MPLERARLIESGLGEAAWNMALDEALLQLQPRRGQATLRFYGWTTPTLSIGYFQKHSSVNQEACRREGVVWIRRPTGGRGVLHDRELTYSFVSGLDSLPLGVNGAHRRISSALARGLCRLGFEAELARHSERGSSQACFDAPSYSELTVRGKKVVGSAQTRSRVALLEHGSIPLELDISRLLALLNLDRLRRGPLAQRLARRAAGLKQLGQGAITLEQLKAALARGFEEEFGFVLEPGEPSPEERALAGELMRKKYRTAAWNLRR